MKKSREKKQNTEVYSGSQFEGTTHNGKEGTEIRPETRNGEQTGSRDGLESTRPTLSDPLPPVKRYCPAPHPGRVQLAGYRYNTKS